MADYHVASTTDTQKEIDAVVGISEVDEPIVKMETNEIEDPVKPDEPEAEQKHGKSGYQKRIDKLTREKYESQKQVSELMTRLEKLEKKAEPVKEVAKVEAPAENAKPKQEDYQDYDAYVEALADWKTDQKLAAKLEEFRKEEARETAEKQQQAVLDEYKKRADDAREKYEDFDDVAFANIDFPKVLEEVILTHENGPDLQYYLGSHKDFTRKLNAMSPAMALLEAGKLMDKFVEESEGEPQEVQKRKSNAPAPIRPIGGSATKSAVPVDDLPYQEYRKLRDQQVKNKYRR